MSSQPEGARITPGTFPFTLARFNLDPTDAHASFKLLAENPNQPRIEAELPAELIDADGNKVSVTMLVSIGERTNDQQDVTVDLADKRLAKSVGLPCSREKFQALLGALANVDELLTDRDPASMRFGALHETATAILEGMRQRAKPRSRVPKKLDVTQAMHRALMATSRREAALELGRHRVTDARPAEALLRQAIAEERNRAKLYAKACELDPTIKKSVVKMMKQMRKERGRGSRVDRQLAQFGHGPIGMMDSLNLLEGKLAKRDPTQGMFGRFRRYDEQAIDELAEALHRRMDDFDRAMAVVMPQIERADRPRSGERSNPERGMDGRPEPQVVNESASQSDGVKRLTEPIRQPRPSQPNVIPFKSQTAPDLGR